MKYKCFSVKTYFIMSVDSMSMVWLALHNVYRYFLHLFSYFDYVDYVFAMTIHAYHGPVGVV